jgi:hypothetical protein
MNSPHHISELKTNEVFVFGANLLGLHGAGAALYAKRNGWARQGVFGELDNGPKGMSYGIPTKDEALIPLRPEEIDFFVKDFIQLAWEKPQLRFLVTPIGCGLAGYKSEIIAPMFRNAPSNVLLPKCFTEALAPLQPLPIDASITGPRYGNGPVCATGTESRVIQDIITRQQKGIAKYGTTVEQNQLSLRQWLEHQYCELLDAAIYCKRAMEELDKK